MTRVCARVSLLCLGVAACGVQALGNSADGHEPPKVGQATDSGLVAEAGSIVDSEIVAEPFVVGEAGVAPEAGNVAEVGVACDDGEQLAKLIQPIANLSTLVVRIDFASRQILGWHYFSDPAAAATTEEGARKVATADTGHDWNSLGVLVPGSAATGELVFFEYPLDTGAAAAVSVTTGQTVFGGSLLWLHSGRTTYPKTWSPAEDLLSICPRPALETPAVGFELDDNTPLLDATELALVLQIVARTKIPDALSRSGQRMINALILRLPRASGDFSLRLEGNEWVSILNLVSASTFR